MILILEANGKQNLAQYQPLIRSHELELTFICICQKPHQTLNDWMLLYWKFSIYSFKRSVVSIQSFLTKFCHFNVILWLHLVLHSFFDCFRFFNDISIPIDKNSGTFQIRLIVSIHVSFMTYQIIWVKLLIYVQTLEFKKKKFVVFKNRALF